MSSEVKDLLSQITISDPLTAQSLGLTQKFTRLMARLKSISDTVTNISGPVSLLETQRQNAKISLLYVDNIILYTTKIKELAAAAKFENVPYAAVLCGEISKINVGIPLQETIEFHKLKEEVAEKVKKTFGEALSTNNKEVIEQYAGLFLHLDLGREGIERYIGYILGSLKEKFVGIEQLSAVCEDVLIKMFRITVKTYEEQQENIEKEFGGSGKIELLQSLQHLVDIHAVNIIEKYCAEVAIKNKSQGLCEEISKIIKHSESFENYLNRLGKEVLKKVKVKNLEEKFSQETALLKSSLLREKILELADSYISLESELMQDQISKCLDKIVVAQYADKNFSAGEVLQTGTIFEAVDEIFFLIQNSASRGMGTLNINSICAILNNIATVVSEEMIESLKKKTPTVKVTWTSQFTNVSAAVIVMLNVMNTCKKCIKKLVATLETQFTKVFGQSGSDSVMFKHCLAAISESEGKIKTFIDEVIYNCTKSFNVNGLLSTFKAISYDLSLEMHSDYEVNDPFALKLIKDVKSLVKQWKVQLNEEVFEAIVDVIAEDIAKGIEQDTKNKKFNELGALQFQKDLREIIGQLQHMSNKPIRHRFAKLKQISELLLAKDDKEISALITDTEWKLAERENIGYRKLRIG